MVTDRSQHGRQVVAVLNVGAMHDETDHHTERVGQDVAFAATDCLAGIEAPPAASLSYLDAWLSVTPTVRLASRPSRSRAAATR